MPAMGAPQESKITRVHKHSGLFLNPIYHRWDKCQLSLWDPRGLHSPKQCVSEALQDPSAESPGASGLPEALLASRSIMDAPWALLLLKRRTSLLLTSDNGPGTIRSMNIQIRYLLLRIRGKMGPKVPSLSMALSQNRRCMSFLWPCFLPRNPKDTSQVPSLASRKCGKYTYRRSALGAHLPLPPPDSSMGYHALEGRAHQQRASS